MILKFQNCTDHTTGNQCEHCDTGYYMNKNGQCSACLCPSASQNNAESCSPSSKGFICQCKKGYTGVHCESCNTGYYDKTPSSGETICEPCNCNPYGTVTNSENSCDNFGRCNCKNGFVGDKCDKCEKEREYIKNGICSRKLLHFNNLLFQGKVRYSKYSLDDMAILLFSNNTKKITMRTAYYFIPSNCPTISYFVLF